jgi:hypothetical protein
LTGGYDSRAVVSSLRHSGAGFAAYVKGSAESDDVTIARRLAAIAGIPLAHDRESELPSPDASDLQRSVGLSLRWQAGFLDTEKHKTFFASGKTLEPGAVRVMGQHGEIGRRFFCPREAGAATFIASKLRSADVESILTYELLKRAPVFIRADVRQRAGELILQAIRQGAPYGLPNLGRLDFFYLYERTRRNNAGSLSSQTHVVITPFLNPDYISAVFACAQHVRDPEAFHRHIVQANTPEWAGVPYGSKAVEPTLGRSREGTRRSGSQDTNESGSPVRPSSRYYDSVEYWTSTGQPLIDDLLARDGFWLEICDRGRARKEWLQAPDELLMLSMLPEALSF